MRLFLADTAFLSWLRVHQPHDNKDYRFKRQTDVATPLHLAAYINLGTVVMVLLEKGAYVDAKTRMGETALQLAAIRGHEAIAKLLLDRGADVNAKTKITALHLATKFGHKAVVRLLLDEGAEVDPKGFKRTPLFMAALRRDKMITKLLLSKGADDDKVYRRVSVPTPS